MSKRTLPQTFICKGCEQLITLAPPPATDTRTQYCSPACKLRVWWRSHEKKVYPPSAEKIARDEAAKKIRLGRRLERAKKRVDKRTQTLTELSRLTQRRICKVCGTQFLKPLRQPGLWQLCSDDCRRAADVANRKRFRRRLAQQGRRTHGKHEKRAKIAGVPYIYGITSIAVFERDGWRCHLCGCSTPKNLRGWNRPNSPELDHIVPLSAGGGHVWENVACSCRRCNTKKGAQVLGQLRLAV